MCGGLSRIGTLPQALLTCALCRCRDAASLISVSNSHVHRPVESLWNPAFYKHFSAKPTTRSDSTKVVFFRNKLVCKDLPDAGITVFPKCLNYKTLMC